MLIHLPYKILLIALQKITFNKHLLTIMPLIFFFRPLYILKRCNINYLLHQLIIVVNNRR